MSQAREERTILVTDLPLSATKEFLQEFFNEGGEVQDVVIKVKEAKNGTAFAFAFILFANKESAERAVKYLNYNKINNVPIKTVILDSETKRAINSGEGRLFIKNLDPTIEVEQLYEAFANFGDVISCKIPTDQGMSCGYGIVHYKRKEDAEQAMRDLCGASINGRPIWIIPYQHSLYTGPDLIPDDDELSELISQFDFGEFQQPKSCVAGKSNKRPNYGNAQKAAEEFNANASKHAQSNDRYKGRNLYIRNFNEDTTEDDLRNIFGQFGRIESVRIMRDAYGKSKKFGFVCYETIEQAEDCLSKSPFLFIFDSASAANKQLYVSLAENKEERSSQRKGDARTPQQHPAQPRGIQAPPVFNQKDAKKTLMTEILQRNPSNKQVLIQRKKDMSDMTAQLLISNMQMLNRWFNYE